MIVSTLLTALALANGDVHLENAKIRLPVPAPLDSARPECAATVPADVRPVVLVRGADAPDPAATAAFLAQLAARCVKVTEPAAADDVRAWARARGHTHVVELSFQAKPLGQGTMAGVKVTQYALSVSARLVALDGRVLAVAGEQELLLGVTLTKAFAARAALRKDMVRGIEKAANTVADAWLADVKTAAANAAVPPKESQ